MKYNIFIIKYYLARYFTRYGINYLNNFLIQIIFTAAVIAAVHGNDEKPATAALPFVQYASPYAYGGVPVYGTPYL